MRKQHNHFLMLLLAVIPAGVIVFALQNHPKAPMHRCRSVNQPPRIQPDYGGTVIPPNIAPLNFWVNENGRHYYVRIYSKQGKPIETFSRTPKISIPEKPWHALLNANRGQELFFDVFVKTKDNGWNRFQTITNTIANEEIDGFLVYRKIHPSHNSWREMGLYQRNMQTFEETPVLKNDKYQIGCAHCHTFWNNRPDKMTVGVRRSDYADYKSSQLIVEGDKAYKFKNFLGFTAWHPSGRLLACSFIKTGLILHSTRNEMRDIVDRDSWIGYFFLNSKKVKTVPQLSMPDQLENYPTWSPDGRYLYFSRAKMLWKDRNPVPPENYDKVKYSLYRIRYDINKDHWGEIEPVLLSEKTGLSMNQPRISPDGRWLTFSMCDYSCWPSYHPDSDLYIVDLKRAQETGKVEYRKMEINSDQCESWHTWASNSRWIVFSSKKGNPLFNRSYIAYVHQDGILSKAFVLPQQDPTFYDSYLKTYTIPELVTGPVGVRGEKLARVIRASDTTALELPRIITEPVSAQ